MHLMTCYDETVSRIDGILLLYAHVLYHRETLGVRDEVREGCCHYCWLWNNPLSTFLFFPSDRPNQHTSPSAYTD